VKTLIMFMLFLEQARGQ